MIYQVGQENQRDDTRYDFFKFADLIYGDLIKASEELQIKVEEPSWIELKSESD